MEENPRRGSKSSMEGNPRLRLWREDPPDYGTPFPSFAAALISYVLSGGVVELREV
jgi:hypothetical protein